MKNITIIFLAIILSSCEVRNCDTCITKDSHPNTSEPKIGIVKKVMLSREGETAQDFIMIFEDENDNEHEYRSETLALPGDTITWY